MSNEMLEIKRINSETNHGNDSSEMELKSIRLSIGVLNRSKQLFKEISSKMGRAGKHSCIAALSTIGASKRAGKTAVLKMEIASRKRKMKEFFSKLGEKVYMGYGDKTPNIFKDISVQGLIDTLKSYDQEIKEIEQYIASLRESNSVKEPIDNSINQPSNIGVDSERRTMITGTLSETQRSAGLSTYVEALKDKDTGARIRALKQLFKFDGSEVIPHLVGALRDNDAEIRRRAALYLGWKVAVSAVPPLIIVTKDRNSSVRRASLEALGELGTKEVAPALIKGLDDRDYDVRKVAYKSLTKVTGKFVEFNAQGPLSERFKSIQKWEKWWQEEKK